MEAAIPTKEGILQTLDEVFSNLGCADEKLHERWRSNIMDTLKQNNWKELLKPNFCLIKRELL